MSDIPPPLDANLQEPSSSGASRGSLSREKREAYWRWNIRYVLALLTVWFAVSYLAGIVFVDQLNRFGLPGSGFKLGFWFAQQGSIYVFVVLIFIYVWLMNRLDKRFGVDEGPVGKAAPEPGVRADARVDSRADAEGGDA